MALMDWFVGYVTTIFQQHSLRDSVSVYNKLEVMCCFSVWLEGILKVKVFPDLAVKARRRIEVRLQSFLVNLVHWMEVNGKLHAPATLTQVKTPVSIEQ
jgi:hypothetical protein